MGVSLAYRSFSRTAKAGDPKQTCLDHKAELDADTEHLVLLSIVGIGPEAQGSLGIFVCALGDADPCGNYRQFLILYVKFAPRSAVERPEKFSG
jgi:hypothetical protein